MRTLRIPHLTSLALFAVSLSVGSATAAPAQRPAADLVITDVNVVDVRKGRVLRNQTVIVSGGEIEKIGGSEHLKGRTARETVDGAGLYLMPGLWDMHAHLRANGLPEWISTEWLMPLLLAHGVTGVREMASECENPRQGPVCLPQLRRWQERIEAGDLLAPRLLALSSFMVDPPWDYEVTEDQVRGMMRHFQEIGLRNVKIYNRLSPAAFEMIMEEADSLGMNAWGHVPLRVSLVNASNRGFRSVEHARDFLYECFPGSSEFRANTGPDGPDLELMRTMVVEHDPATCEEVFRTLVQNGTWYVPTHVTRRTEAFAGDSAFRADPRAVYVPRALMQQWIEDADRTVARDPSPSGRAVFTDFYLAGLEITGAAHRAGVRIMVGTDGGDSFVFPGSAVHDELEELVKAGLSPAAALRAATWNGAEFLGVTELYGSVEAGKRADLILLSANPLEHIENVRHIAGVVFAGEYLDRNRLDLLLRQAQSAAGMSLEGGGD